MRPIEGSLKFLNAEPTVGRIVINLLRETAAGWSERHCFLFLIGVILRGLLHMVQFILLLFGTAFESLVGNIRASVDRSPREIIAETYLLR